MKPHDASPRIARFGRFEADLRAAELRKNGVRVSLQEQPFQILALLIEHRGQLVTREELRRHLWSEDTFVDFDRNLNKAINKLRSALGDSAERPQFIETLHRRGYRFIASVVCLTGNEPRLAPASGPSPIVPLESSLSVSTAQDQTRVPGTAILPRHTRYWQVVALAAGLLLGLVIYLGIPLPVAFGGARSANDGRPSVVVLEFRNLTGDPQQAWLSAALKDWLTTELSAGQRLRTICSEGVARNARKLDQLDALDRDGLLRMRKTCGTDYVVVGSYASVGKPVDGQIRLDLRLEDTRSGGTAAAISETGAQTQLFELVSQAGQNLRSKLGVASINGQSRADSGLPSGKSLKNSL